MQNQTFGYKNPVQYIINLSEERKDDLRCGICFQFVLAPYKCTGRCKKIICSPCYSKWRSQKKQCPSRCSQQAFTIKRVNLDFQFKCSFDQISKMPITSLSEFNNHYKQAQKLSSQKN